MASEPTRANKESKASEIDNALHALDPCIYQLIFLKEEITGEVSEQSDKVKEATLSVARLMNELPGILRAKVGRIEDNVNDIRGRYSNG